MAGHPLSMPIDWDDTAAFLHGRARVIGAVAKTHGIAHPQWWHIALRVQAEGLSTVPLPLAGGGVAAITLDLVAEATVVRNTSGPVETIPFSTQDSLATYAQDLTAVAKRIGLDKQVDLPDLESDSQYDREHGSELWKALLDVSAVLEGRRAALPGAAGPVCFWPRGFDLSFEWFGSHVIERDKGREIHAQLDLGFYPRGDAYFYSSPSPFDDDLLSSPLPTGARWNTDDWNGSLMPFSELEGDPKWAERVLGYAEAVYEAARPSLMA